MDTRRSAPSLLSPAARFGIAYFALSTIYGVFSPYFQKMLSIQGFHEQEIGFIFGVLETFGILAPPLWGWLSDRSSHRRRLLVAAAAGVMISFLSFGRIAQFWPALAAGAALGFFLRPIAPLLDGMALRYIGAHGGDFGRMRTPASIAFICTILVLEAIGVGGSGALGIILGAAAASAILTCAATSVLPLTDREVAERNGAIRRGHITPLSTLWSRPFVSITLVAFLMCFSMVSHYNFFTLFVQKEFKFPAAGYIWIIGPIAEIAVVYFSSAFVGRLGVCGFFALGPAATALRLAGYAIAPSIEWIMALQLLHSFAYGAYYFASVHYIDRIVPDDIKQSAMAIFLAATIGLAGITGSAIGGVIIHQFSFRTMFACYAGVAVLSLLGLIALIREPPEKSRVESRECTCEGGAP